MLIIVESPSAPTADCFRQHPPHNSYLVPRPDVYRDRTSTLSTTKHLLKAENFFPHILESFRQKEEHRKVKFPNTGHAAKIIK